MTATEVIAGYQTLPPAEQAGVVEWILSAANDDAVLTAFDRLPRGEDLSEEQILALPRRANFPR